MKLLTLKIILVFTYLISSSTSYAIQQPKFKNLIVHKDPLKHKEIAFYDLNNELINLDNYKNSLVIINFWATWCAPCREEMPSLNKLKVNSNFKNLTIFPINVGKEEILKSKQFYKDLKINNLKIFFDKTNNLAKKAVLKVKIDLILDKLFKANKLIILILHIAPAIAPKETRITGRRFSK